MRKLSWRKPSPSPSPSKGEGLHRGRDESRPYIGIEKGDRHHSEMKPVPVPTPHPHPLPPGARDVSAGVLIL